MQKDIHPNYSAVTATCTCGNTLNLNSTLGSDLHVDVCSNCHPFYTGQQKMVDTGGRVDRFNKRFGARRTTK
ncbi:50S ribosomal protein L31 [Marinomonas rhizomae]|uniref:50S ribosomal protein L31 n=1 Tax=Marinomonas rhizomae TaxID=491948 RepID=UPI0021056DD7|nr:50S ribosomal protein L31 [Marinomonas rhizomae]UTW01658.1 50S ribosomal protein L31 [Marinomonas rhizomae]